MKKIIVKLSLLGVMALTCSSALSATKDEQELFNNFKTCQAENPAWFNNWGQYVVGFNLDKAYNTCRDMYWPHGATVRMAGCRVSGHWLEAGYYCQENNN